MTHNVTIALAGLALELLCWGVLIPIVLRSLMSDLDTNDYARLATSVSGSPRKVVASLHGEPSYDYLRVAFDPTTG